MENYLEQIYRIKYILYKCNYENNIKFPLEKGTDSLLTVGIVGVNIIKHDEIIKKLYSETSNIKYLNLNSKNGEADINNISCDIIVQIIDAVQPLSKGDYKLFTNLSKYYNNIIFIVSRLNYVDYEEISELKDYIEVKINKISSNGKVFYLDEEISSNYFINYLKEISIDDVVKNNIKKFKVKELCKEGIRTIGEEIRIFENWEDEKKNKIEDMNSMIDKLYSYGEGYALYFMRYKERVENYITKFGMGDINYIKKCLDEFLSSIQGSFRKYFEDDIEEIVELRFKIGQDMSSPSVFIEDIRIVLNKNMQRAINKINYDIQILKNKSKDIEKINILKESYRELLKINEEVGYEQ